MKSCVISPPSILNMVQIGNSNFELSGAVPVERNSTTICFSPDGYIFTTLSATSGKVWLNSPYFFMIWFLDCLTIPCPREGSLNSATSEYIAAIAVQLCLLKCSKYCLTSFSLASEFTFWLHENSVKIESRTRNVFFIFVWIYGKV